MVDTKRKFWVFENSRHGDTLDLCEINYHTKKREQHFVVIHNILINKN